MEWFDGVANKRLSRFLARGSGKSVTLVGRDSEYMKASVISVIEADAKWNRKRYIEDFLLIEPENGNIGIDRIRDIEEMMLHKPAIDKRKFVLINQCEKMTDESANAFLKVLEEPPDFATLIMITSSWQSLLPTVRSRTISIVMDIPEELMNRLKSDYGERVSLIYASAQQSFSVLRFFLERDPESITHEAFGVPSDLEGLKQLIVESVEEVPIDLVRRRRAFAALCKSFVDSRSFFSAFREVSSIFIGQGSFERARELVEVSRSLLRDIVILSADTPNDSLTNIDLLEWLVNFKPGKHILEDFVWCDSFLRQRTSSLSATLVSFRALYALSRSLVRRNNGGN